MWLISPPRCQKFQEPSQQNYCHFQASLHRDTADHYPCCDRRPLRHQSQPFTRLFNIRHGCWIIFYIIMLLFYYFIIILITWLRMYLLFTHILFGWQSWFIIFIWSLRWYMNLGSLVIYFALIRIYFFIFVSICMLNVLFGYLLI